MSRKKARELVMIKLYQMEIHSEFIIEEDFEKNLAGKVHDGREVKYAMNILKKFIDQKSEIDGKIENNSENWKIDRISKIDLAIIRLALVEIFHDKTVPTSVAINEAVQLSKKFSDDKSYQFVNGILGNIVREK